MMSIFRLTAVFLLSFVFLAPAQGSLLCVDLLGPLRKDEVEAPEGFQVIVATPRFLIGTDRRIGGVKGVVLSRQGFQFLGIITLIRQPGNRAQLLLEFSRPGSHPGLGTEVKFAMMKYAFEVLGVDVIPARILSTNLASVALHRKLGFHLTDDSTSFHEYELSRQDYDALLLILRGQTLQQFVAPRRLNVSN